MKSIKYILYGKKENFLRDQRAGNVGPSCPIATGFTSSRHLTNSAIIIRGRPLGITEGRLTISKKNPAMETCLKENPGSVGTEKKKNSCRGNDKHSVTGKIKGGKVAYNIA